MSPEAEARLEQLREKYNEIATRVKAKNDELLKKYYALYTGKHRPTQAGFAYFINSLDFEGEWNCKLKVGVSTDPFRRLDALSTGNPHPLLLRHFILSYDAPKLERLIHNDLDEFRGRGEWFDDERHVANRMFGSDAYKGMNPDYEYLGAERVMDTSIATHYFHKKIDLLDEHIPNEYLVLKQDLSRTYEMIKRVIIQENMFGGLRF